MNKELKVSVVIPVFNVASYIDRCVQSVIRQSYPNIEVILVDDGSTDESGTKCDQWHKADDRIKVVHKVNGGLSSARNVGILNSTGEYVVFLDSDDCWNGDFLWSFIKQIGETKDAQCDMLLGCAQKVSELTNEIHFIGKQFDGLQFHAKLGKDVVDYILSVEPSFEWYPWRYFFRREFLIENKLQFTEGIIYEDVDLIPRALLLAERVLYSDIIFINYTYHRSGSLLNTINIKRSCDKVNVSSQAMSSVQRANIEELLAVKLFSNFSMLFLSGYIDNLRVTESHFDKITKDGMALLQFNKTTLGRLIWMTYRIFGFRIGKLIVKFVLKLNKLKNNSGE